MFHHAHRAMWGPRVVPVLSVAEFIPRFILRRIALMTGLGRGVFAACCGRRVAEAAPGGRVESMGTARSASVGNMRNKANLSGRDCFPRLREGRLASLLAMTRVRVGLIVRNKANFEARPPGAEGREMSNEPNLPRLWPGNGGGVGNEANRCGEAAAIGDLGLPIRGSECGECQTKPISGWLE